MVVPRARSRHTVNIISLGMIATLIGIVGPHIDIWLWRVLAAAPTTGSSGPPQALTGAGTNPAIGLNVVQAQPGALLLTCGLLIGIGLFVTSYHSLPDPPASERTRRTDETEPTTDHDTHHSHDPD